MTVLLGPGHGRGWEQRNWLACGQIWGPVPTGKERIIWEKGKKEKKESLLFLHLGQKEIDSEGRVYFPSG